MAKEVKGVSRETVGEVVPAATIGEAPAVTETEAPVAGANVAAAETAAPEAGAEPAPGETEASAVESPAGDVPAAAPAVAEAPAKVVLTAEEFGAKWGGKLKRRQRQIAAQVSRITDGNYQRIANEFAHTAAVRAEMLADLGYVPRED